MFEDGWDLVVCRFSLGSPLEENTGRGFCLGVYEIVSMDWSLSLKCLFKEAVMSLRVQLHIGVTTFLNNNFGGKLFFVSPVNCRV